MITKETSGNQPMEDIEEKGQGPMDTRKIKQKRRLEAADLGIPTRREIGGHTFKENKQN